MIKLQIIGSLGKDAIVKEVNGKQVINFSVAHLEKWKDAQGNQKERTTWVEAAYWNDSQKLAQYLTKGSQVFIEGSPEADAYLANDGSAKGTLRVRVMNIQLLGGKREAQPGQQQTAAAPVAPVSADDDLPF